MRTLVFPLWYYRWEPGVSLRLGAIIHNGKTLTGPRHPFPFRAKLLAILFVLCATSVSAQTLRELSNRPDPQALNREQIEARERARLERDRQDRDALNIASWVYISAAAADYSVTAVCARVLCGDRTQTGLFFYGIEEPKIAIPLAIAADALVLWGVREFVAPDHPKIARALLYGSSGFRLVLITNKVSDLRTREVRR